MAGRRQSINLPGLAHGAPIPMGSKVGNMVYSSGINGADPATGKRPDDPDQEAVQMFANVTKFMEVAGGTTEDIVQVTLLLGNADLRKHIDKPWLEMFPDENNRPARHALTTEVRAGRFQMEIVAVLP